MTKYLFRVDDVCPSMHSENFNKLKKVFLKYKINPILALIPNNKDKKIMFQKANEKNLLKELKKLETKGWIVAMHGHTHEMNGDGGLLKINKFGEFGGINFETQLKKIKQGKNILEKKGFTPNIFVAPAHSFDKNTLKALKKEKIEIISDGIGLYPYKRKGIIFIPQTVWNPRKLPLGVITICLHPQDLDDKKIKSINEFIRKNITNISDINTVISKYNNTGYIKKVLFNIINFIFSKMWYVTLYLHRRSK